jgi:NADH-quinone oxidoreductase subunit N
MSFILLAPEVVVLLVACLIVLLDLGVRTEEGRARLAYVGVAGNVVAIVVAIVTLGGRREVSFFDTYVVDPAALFFKVLFLIACSLTLMASTVYVRRRGIAGGEYYATMMFATFGFMLMASARELITVYISLEMASIPLYMLVAMMKNDLRSTEGGIKYLLLGALSSAAFLYGMALLYAATGSTILPEIARALPGASPALSIVAIVLVTAGLGFKIAAVPFHMWVPDVYQGAPTPTTAFLSVASKSAGFILALRFFSLGLGSMAPTWSPMIAVLAAITMTVGNVAALRQTNVKRLLGYSSIGQAGYAMMALAVPSAEAVSGLMFFLLVYTLQNLGAFAGVIAIGNQIGSDEIEDYRGVGQRSGALALFTTLCFLSLVGMPPMAGFVSKFYLFLQVFQQGYVWLVLVAVLNTGISAYYYIKVVRAMYFAPSAEAAVPVVASGSLRASLWLATAAVFVVGLAAGPFIQTTTDAGRLFFP